MNSTSNHSTDYRPWIDAQFRLQQLDLLLLVDQYSNSSVALQLDLSLYLAHFLLVRLVQFGEFALVAFELLVLLGFLRVSLYVRVFVGKYGRLKK